MDIQFNMPEPEFRALGLVRDKNGRPKVDDPASLPDEIKAMLSEEDKAWLSL